MNCKPGDLAIIVFSPILSNIGAIVTIHESYDAYGPGGWCVTCSSKLMSARGLPINAFERFHADDEHLRPIIPPPGSVTDEEVKELYSPEKEKA